MSFFKTFVAASLFLMSAGFGCAGEALFVKGTEKAMVVKSSTGFWVIKKI